jgi:hypothetical protein
MRDIGKNLAMVPFAMAHALTLSAQDIVWALEESNRESRCTDASCFFSNWEAISLEELSAFHRQAFFWRFLKEHPLCLWRTLAQDSENSKAC